MKLLTVLNTILISIIAVFLVALLRGYAELLRRTTDHAKHEETRDLERLPSRASLLPEGRSRSDSPAFDLTGATLDGGALKVTASGGQNTLLAFLSSGCLTCQSFWRGMGQVSSAPLPAAARIVVVTKDREYESPHKLRELATANVPLIMSSKAWTDYGVELSPYFVFVDGNTGQVVSEGTGTDWEQVISLLRDSFEDLLLASAASSEIG